MNQIAIDFASADQPMILSVVECQSFLFRPDFRAWLADNFHIWLAFEREANHVWTTGRRHYSARTIGEYLRHETALREK